MQIFFEFFVLQIILFEFFQDESQANKKVLDNVFKKFEIIRLMFYKDF
jgi:hypothetical protein